jgi:superfamily II DNA or RNA helicase
MIDQYTIVSPIKMYVPASLDKEALKRVLTYHDKKVEFQIKRLKGNRFLARKMGAAAFGNMISDLEEQRTKCLLFEDEAGFYTYPSLLQKINTEMTVSAPKVEDRISYPEPQLIPWSKPPYKEMRPYQKEIVQKLLSERHAGVEVATGLGKSFCILNICKQLGLKTVIMTPSISIAKQIHAEFLEAFGHRYVGAFFDGKKESNKKFVVSVAASLVKATGKHRSELASAEVFIADESHTCPAKTLEEVCHGLMMQAQYRFFFSGTQLRSDGLGLLLEAITGPILYRMSVRDGVEQGYLSKPNFVMVKTRSSSDFRSEDANEMTRQHFFYNPNVNKKAAEIANKTVEVLKHPVLILVDEFEQFAHLLPHLKHPVKFAHGGVTASNSELIPKEYHQSEPNELVEQFNNLEFPILVGTSCISTGTDIRSVRTIIFLMAGKSETQIRQSVGRGTRLFADKTEFKFFDFDVENIDIMHRHASERVTIYDNIYGPVKHLG